MEIRYKLLRNGEGVIITRQPQIVSGELHVYFEGAPPNATAIFTSSEASYYRNLSGNECSVPAIKMSGEVSVTLTVLDGTSRVPKWRCEGLLFQKHENGDLFVLPNDMNIPGKFVKIKIEFDELKEYSRRLERKILKLEKKLEEIAIIKIAIKELSEIINQNKYI